MGLPIIYTGTSPARRARQARPRHHNLPSAKMLVLVAGGAAAVVDAVCAARAEEFDRCCGVPRF
jgi:hypothetical protein